MGTNGRAIAIRAQMLLLETLISAEQIRAPAGAMLDGKKIGGRWIDKDTPYTLATTPGEPKPEKADLVEQVAPKPQINLSLTTQAEVDEAIAADGEQTKSIIEKVMDGFGTAKDAAIRGVDMAVGALTGTDFSAEDAAEAVKSKFGEIAEQAKLVGQQDLGHVLMGAAIGTAGAVLLLSAHSSIKINFGRSSLFAEWNGKLLKAGIQAVIGFSTPELYATWFGLNFLVHSAFAIHDRMAEKSKLEELTGADSTEVLTIHKNVSEEIEKSMKSRRKDMEAKMVETLKAEILGSVESIAALERAMGSDDPNVLKRKMTAIMNKLTKGLKVKDLERHYGLDLAAVRQKAAKEAIAEIRKRIEENPEVQRSKPEEKRADYQTVRRQASGLSGGVLSKTTSWRR